MAVSEKDFVNVESGTDETYVALDQEIEVYDVEEAIDGINGSIVNGDLEQKVDYLADTKDMIRQAIINKGQPVEETASFRSYAESIGELTGEINNQDVLITENGTYEAESGYTGLGEVTVEVQPALQDKVITQNGTYRADTGYDGLGNVVVNTPVINNQDKTITENGVYTADSGYSGLGEITVEVPAPEPTLDTLTATTNGNYTPPAGIDGYDEVVVNVQPALQDKTITENGTYSADSGFYGLGEVVVSTPEINNQDKQITANGTYTADQGYSGLGEVSVDVQPDLQDKTITSNGTYTADSGYDGLGEVVVDVPAPQPVLEDKTIRVNGTYTAGAGYDGLGEVVVDVADIPAVVEPLSVSPTTSQQIITPPANVDGFDQVTVSAVDSSIDANIVSGNIKSGVSILGVSGSVVEVNNQNKTVSQNGVYVPDSGYTGLGEVTVNVPAPQPVLDTLNVTANGTYTPPANVDGYDEVVVNVADTPAVIDPLSITPSTSQQVITASSGIDGFSPITVDAVTSAIDSNIVAGNIKSGVSILGVVGSCVELNAEATTLTPTISATTVYPTSPYNALSSVTVEAVDSSIDSNIQSQNIRRGVTILGVTGNMDPVVNETKTITMNGTYVPSSGYTGFGQITVNVGSSSLSGSFQPYSVSATNTLVLGTRLPDTTSSTPVSFVGINDIGDSTLYRAYLGNTNITGSLDMSDLTQITGYQAATYAFSGTAITSVDMSRITMITGYFATSGMFQNCTQLTSFDLSALEEVSGGAAACSAMFSGCTGLTSANLSALRIVTSQGGISNMFDGCVNLASVNLSSLEDLTGLGHLQGTFKNCRALTSLSFPALTPSSFDSRTSHFVTMCEGIPNITIHFPASVQSIIESEQGYSTTAPFGAISGTVLFDL